MRVTSSFVIRDNLEKALRKIGGHLGADAACIAGPLYPGIDFALRESVETGKDGRKKNLAVILDTNGGVAEVVERMVKIIRHTYAGEVVFIVPDSAMSAGTMLVMSGDRILMNYYSCLGPIDAQVEKDDGTLLSTVSYLRKFEEMKEKSKTGEITPAEVALLEKMNLAELEEYQQEAELAKELLTNWLSTYKFKSWKKTEKRGTKVTPQMRRERATQIAETLGDYNRWHTHGRPIGIDTLREIGLLVENYAEDEKLEPLAGAVEFYFDLMKDFMAREKIRGLVQLGNSLEAL